MIEFVVSLCHAIVVIFFVCLFVLALLNNLMMFFLNVKDIRDLKNENK